MSELVFRITLPVGPSFTVPLRPVLRSSLTLDIKLRDSKPAGRERRAAPFRNATARLNILQNIRKT